MISSLPLGGVGWVSEDSRNGALELGGLMMLPSFDERHHGQDHEDHGGPDGPTDLELGVAVDLGRHRVLLGAEPVHRVDQRALDEHEHHRGDVQDDHVQRVDLVGVRRAPGLGGDEVRERARREHEREDRGRQRCAHEPGGAAAALGVGSVGSQGARFYPGPPWLDPPVLTGRAAQRGARMTALGGRAEPHKDEVGGACRRPRLTLAPGRRRALTRPRRPGGAGQ